MFMHHHPLESQGVYTTPTPKQVMEDLAVGPNDSIGGAP
jgi:hypothetical protein